MSAVPPGAFDGFVVLTVLNLCGNAMLTIALGTFGASTASGASTLATTLSPPSRRARSTASQTSRHCVNQTSAVTCSLRLSRAIGAWTWATDVMFPVGSDGYEVDAGTCGHTGAPTGAPAPSPRRPPSSARTSAPASASTFLPKYCASHRG